MTQIQKSRLIGHMERELASRIDQIVEQLATDAVITGLEPACQKIGSLFAANSEEFSAQNLYNFCCRYIQLVPKQAAAIQASANDLGLTHLVRSYLELALNYLDSACTELENATDRESNEAFLILLQGAYIFARMQEELDDKIQAFIGVPLTATDLMDANLIVHEIIGDQFANRLDKVVASLIQQSKISKLLIEANLDQSKIEQAKKDHLSLVGEGIQSFAEQYGLSMISGLL